MEQVRLLETIANQAALLIDNARIFKEMKLLAITDSMTGLFNRRHFSELGQVEVERAVRYQRGLGVLMVDIDLFKRVNDTLGHRAGDAVLQAVSRMCRAQLRSSDIIGRYGGEEFAIVLPESSEERARAVAERIRASIEATPIDTPNGPAQVTISLGLALLSPTDNDLELLLDSADRAMYEAKQAGRNRVQVYSP
jgi:diguanylate cyclase (GGDEF)-like protein